MRTNTHTLYLAIIAFLGALLIGIAAFAVWVGPFLLSKEAQRQDDLFKILVAASLLKYGTVVSTDTTQHTIRISVLSSFAGAPAPQFTVHVDPSAYIGREELQAGPDGVYTTIPTPAAATLADIRPGDRVAMMFGHQTDDQISTSYILFGNPL